MATNPRIEELKKRLEKEPNSRVFAQLAEELRKEGDFLEAIRLSREGLQKHPAYPSARMTLGRALMDYGDLQGAGQEFAAVLKSAPENILASRYLAECHEGLGNIVGAVAQYKATLLLAPADRQLRLRLEGLEKRLAAEPPEVLPVGGTTVSGFSTPQAEFETTFEMEHPFEGVSQPTGTAAGSQSPSVPAPSASPRASPASTAEAEPKPIPLVEADETFELERPYDAQGRFWVGGSSSATASTPGEQAASWGPSTESTAPSGLGFGVPAFDLSAKPPVPSEPGPPAAVVETAPGGAEGVGEVREGGLRETADASITAAEEGASDVGSSTGSASLQSEPSSAPAEEPSAAIRAEPAAVPADSTSPEIISSTLAELYFNQGHNERAMEMYRQVLQQDPGNERARARLAEIEALERYLSAEESRMKPRSSSGQATPDSHRAKRQAIERTISRLEGLLAAIKRG